MSDDFHLTQPQVDQAIRFTQQVLGLLGASSWVVHIMLEPASEDALASVQIVRNRYVAEIKLSVEWGERTPEERMEVLVHEALHILHHRVTRVIDDTCGDYIPFKLHGTWFDLINTEMEHFVDQVSTAIAHLGADHLDPGLGRLSHFALVWNDSAHITGDELIVRSKPTVPGPDEDRETEDQPLPEQPTPEKSTCVHCHHLILRTPGGAWYDPTLYGSASLACEDNDGDPHELEGAMDEQPRSLSARGGEDQRVESDDTCAHCGARIYLVDGSWRRLVDDRMIAGCDRNSAMLRHEPIFQPTAPARLDTDPGQER